MSWLLRIRDSDTGAEVYERPCTSGDNAKLWARQWRNRRDGMLPSLKIVATIYGPDGHPWLETNASSSTSWRLTWRQP